MGKSLSRVQDDSVETIIDPGKWAKLLLPVMQLGLRAANKKAVSTFIRLLKEGRRDHSYHSSPDHFGVSTERLEARGGRGNKKWHQCVYFPPGCGWLSSEWLFCICHETQN